MPIFYQQDIDGDTSLGIWKIAENESFFDVPLQRDITHPHKRLQHLAGRYLLRYLEPAFPLSLIKIADTRKPFLEDEAWHFSVSHCDDFAAVMLSRYKRVGVDIELASEKLARIQHKFLSSQEALLHTDVHLTPLKFLTLSWSAKEAVFKWYGKGALDFKNHMVLNSMKAVAEHQYTVTIDFRKAAPIVLELECRFFGDLCLSRIATEVLPL